MESDLKTIEQLLNLRDDTDLQVFDSIQSLGDRVDDVETKIEDLTVNQPVPLKGEKGDRGDKGDTGDSFIPTRSDLKKIASMVEVPIVERIIEKTEVIREVPIVTETIKETKIENPVTPDEVIEKINTSNKKIKPSQVEGLADLERIAKANVDRALPVTTTFFSKNGTVIGRAKNINFVEGVNTTLSVQQVGDVMNVTITSTGSGGGSFSLLRPTGTVDGSNTTFVFASAPSIIVVDEGRTMQKLQRDNLTANWTGTTTVILSIAPNFDIYGY